MTEPTDPARLETLPPTAAAGPVRGTPLGSRYVLEHPIGEGSTGRVWQGVRRADGSAVAIKVLHAEYAVDPMMVARFRRESIAVRELRHPHLVPVDDLVVEQNAIALVMELVNGDDLRRIIQRGRPDTRRAVSLLAQVAHALAYVHAAGVLHRDVKPENILVTRRAGQPCALLSDFGLAWVAGARQLTRSTQLIGTPAYLAPELLAGRPYGPAVDVYALGVTGYELLTGRRPFDGEHPLAVMRAHLDDEAPRPVGMTPDLWRVIRSCLAKRPEDRPSAADLAEQLESLARRRRVLSGAAHASRLRWPKRRLALVAGILATGLAAAPVVWWLGSPKAGPARVAAHTSARPTSSPPPLAVAPPPSSAPASPSPPPTMLPLTPAVGEIVGPGGNCLDDQSSETAKGNPVQSWLCNNSAAQLWTVGADGTLRVVSRCLQVGTGGTVRIWVCDGSTAEQWQRRVAGGGLVNVATGKCLDSTGDLGARPTVRTCTGSASQRWKLP